MSKSIKAIKKIVHTYFKDSNNEPFPITDSQCRLFAGIVDRRKKWLWISAPTRYGKSETLALAIIYLAVFERLKIPVVAGSKDKAKKIMDYVVAHIADHPELHNGLINVKGIDDVEKLKITISKNALRWSNGGWIFVTSIDSRSIISEGEGAVGEGGDVVILEEAGLIKREGAVLEGGKNDRAQIWLGEVGNVRQLYKKTVCLKKHIKVASISR